MRGTTDDLVARNAAQTASPATYDSLARQNVQIEPLGPQLWDVTVRYGSSDSGGNPTPSEAVQLRDRRRHQHITQSKDTVQARAASGSTAPDFGGAIGVTADGVDGVDITVPVYQFSETHYFSDAQVTGAYKGGDLQFAPARPTPAGSGLCARRGAVPRRDGLEAWTGPTTTGRSPSGSRPAPTRNRPLGRLHHGHQQEGWEYLWVRYADAEDTGSARSSKKPIAAYVERVYDDANFGALGI